MHGFGVDPHAPRYPFVLPTLLFRPFKWFWKPLISAVLWFLSSIWTALTAWLGILFEDEGSAKTIKSSKPSVMGTNRPSDRLYSVKQVRRDGDDSNIAARDFQLQRSLDEEAREGYDTMESDKVVSDGKKSAFGFAKLWSWSGGSSSVTSSAPSTVTADVFEADSADDLGWEDIFPTAASQQMHDSASGWRTEGDGMDADVLL